MINPISTLPYHGRTPDWARFLYDNNTPTTGESAEERNHQEIALQMHLHQLEQRQPLVVQTARMFVEFGANLARVIPSLMSQMIVWTDLDAADDSWALLLDIPQTPAGQRLLTIIRELCDLDDTFWPRWERDTPFQVFARNRRNNSYSFILTGDDTQALVLLRKALGNLL